MPASAMTRGGEGDGGGAAEGAEGGGGGQVGGDAAGGGVAGGDAGVHVAFEGAHAHAGQELGG
jgi:hypothetical protein